MAAAYVELAVYQPVVELAVSAAPRGLPGTDADVSAFFDALPSYPNDETAAADNYTGKYYFIGGVDADGNASDIGADGLLKKRLDI